MEKTYNPALIQRTQRYMETHSISQNQFAAKVNLSSAALSSYLNQKYKGSVEAVERQLSEFFKLDEEAEAAAEKTASLLPRAAYVPTSISEDVCQSIRFAQLEHCMVVLHGDAGVGKSKGAQKFLRDHPTNAVGISITPSTGTLNGSIKLLARALRVPECRNKMDQMMALRSRLDGTNWVIVIDEAQHLKYAALEEIRSLTDDNPMTGSTVSAWCSSATAKCTAACRAASKRSLRSYSAASVCSASTPPARLKKMMCGSCSQCWPSRTPARSWTFC